MATVIGRSQILIGWVSINAIATCRIGSWWSVLRFVSRQVVSFSWQMKTAILSLRLHVRSYVCIRVCSTCMYVYEYLPFGNIFYGPGLTKLMDRRRASSNELSSRDVNERMYFTLLAWTHEHSSDLLRFFFRPAKTSQLFLVVRTRWSARRLGRATVEQFAVLVNGKYWSSARARGVVNGDWCSSFPSQFAVRSTRLSLR